MMPAMTLPAMPQNAMMSGMTGMPGMGMPMMGMMPMMPNMMMPQMMGMMPQMGMMPPMAMGVPMMCKMTMEMGKDGMVCKVMPTEGTTMDAMRERCESMMKMMASGLPVMMMCGGQMMMANHAK